MGERRGTKALELWCRRITDSYPGVSVQNMTTSWRDGLAFCAMIHHFRPDLIDFASLNKDDIYGNNELAFRTAEQHLGIPALLDAEDMASCSVPDRLSILTYLSQFYQVFGGSSPSRLALNRTSENSSERIGSVPESPQPKVSSRLGMRRESCASCNLPVFLAEKLVVSRSAYHRSCFRCARCRQQLTPGNYYETEEGQYCCEACPADESPGVALLEAPLSDEEKSKRRSLEREELEKEEKKEVEEEENDADGKFDEMIRMISDRIDELTNERKIPEERATSPDARHRRDSRVNSAPDVVECRQASNASNAVEQDEPKRPAVPVLKRSSSLRDTGEHTTKDPCTNAEIPRRLSLVQRRLRLFELEPKPESKPESNTRSYCKPQPIQEVKHVMEQQPIEKDDYPEDLNPFASSEGEDRAPTIQTESKQRSTNPFDSTDEEKTPEEMGVTPKPIARTRSRGVTETPTKRLLEAPQINLNPFWSDDEEPESGLDSEPESRSKSPPVPKPRTFRHSHMDESLLLYPKSNLMSSSIHSSNTSIASSCSTITPGGTYRKKKPAPPPPIPNPSFGTPIKPLNTSTNSNPSLSPKFTPRIRKSKPAPTPPLPPTAASTPTHELSWRHSANTLPKEPASPDRPDNDRMNQQHQLWNEEKLSKDEANRNTQNLSCTDVSTYLPYSPDKSVEGKWKRKKGPAPPRPIPLRRKIKVMSMKDVKLELDQIEMQQQGLEKQGVRLEQIIRDKCESGTASEDTNLGLDVEELVLELFTLVNEKNELFRRQAELMLLRRQQRLEEEHADIEYQVRCLITQPEATKTDFDKQREETLIQRLVEIVERRNEIVECLEMDRRREVEEDRSIHREMDLYAARNKSDIVNLTDESRRSSKLKKGKIKEKIKEKKSKKSNKKDADKDVDETEAKLKRHSLRKWF